MSLRQNGGGNAFGGSDGQYLIRRSGVWAPATPSYLDLSNVPASFTPTPHASTHYPGGSDDVTAILRLMPGPAINGYTTWTYDYVAVTQGLAPTAGVVYLAKILTAHAYTLSNIDFSIHQGGTGATSLANCFIGVYSSDGTRRFLSSDQSSNWTGTGIKTIALGGSPYTVTANDFIYVALLVGTQSTTAVQLKGINLPFTTSANVGVAAARWASQLTGQTSLPSSLTYSSNAAAVLAWWFGIH